MEDTNKENSFFVHLSDDIAPTRRKNRQADRISVRLTKKIDD
jgi:hypothetical protein